MWYAQSQKAEKMFTPEQTFLIENFTDRNLINAQIRSLEDISSLLSYCSQLVFQTQRGAQGVVAKIRQDKKVSSFPNVLEILDKADKLALDSPPRFAELCKTAAFEIDLRIGKLIKLRKDYGAGIKDLSKPQKGLF